jgi:hypothetical protein
VDTDPRWSGVLDAIEADARTLIDNRFVTEHGARSLYAPPRDLGPLPEEFRTRAESVVAALAAAGTTVEIQLAAIRGELRRVSRSQGVASDAPAHDFVGGFDTRV